MAREYDLLEVENLNTSFKIDAGKVLSVNGVSFKLQKGKVLGIVGESGSGKSVTAYSIMQILDQNGKIDSGKIIYNGTDLVKVSEEEMRKIRGNRISIIFQDAMTSLNPTWSIGNQLREAILTHAKNQFEEKIEEIENEIESDKQRIIALNKGITNHPERKELKDDLKFVENKLAKDEENLVKEKERAAVESVKLKNAAIEKYKASKKEFNKKIKAAFGNFFKNMFKFKKVPSNEEVRALKEYQENLPPLEQIKGRIERNEKRLEDLEKDVKNFSKPKTGEGLEEFLILKSKVRKEKEVLKGYKKEKRSIEKKMSSISFSYKMRKVTENLRNSYNALKESFRAKKTFYWECISSYKETKYSANLKAIKMLEEVGITEPKKRMKQYPFELSGGMLQRCMIAMALIERPDILIADEPTTALDVTIQAQILELLKKLQKEYGMAIIIITHDLGVIAQICDEVNIMYAGRIVEKGSVDEIFYNPKHEYTKGLLNSMPKIDTKEERLEPISGNPVDLFCLPKGCAFSSRCKKCMEICIERYPEEVEACPNHYVSCFKAIKDLHDKGVIDVVNATPEGKPLVYNGAVIAEQRKK